jgi:SAM-dependent methyltransferase
MTKTMPTCRFCAAPLRERVVDLGLHPLSNGYLTAAQLGLEEPRYPLCVYLCTACLLMQIKAVETPEAIFGDTYAYFSSFSTSFLAHAKRYVDEMVARFGLTPEASRIVEVASNDGYLLQYFVQRGFHVLGIEPTAGTAAAAREKGVETLEAFFGAALAARLADEGRQADLLLGNNVLAHVPDINDFISGLRRLLKPDGVITMEFPHLLRLIEQCQFDTVYHEHFSYLSLNTVETMFRKHGLTIFDVDELPTHGGSLRIYACHAGSDRPVGDSVARVKRREADVGLLDIQVYRRFRERVQAIAREFQRFLNAAAAAGKTVAAYGAAAKGNTLLNYCDVSPASVAYVVDRNPHKQGLYMPGSHIPILAVETVWASRPDYLLILPWNLRDEIAEQMADIRKWGGQFVVTIPALEVF